ncbi:MAG: hypothetical protein LUD40_16500 [Phocaeicola dorei]|nr:hypothetical protein [Phocaeicola dorei]
MSGLMIIVITYCLFLLPFIILCASPYVAFNIFAGLILVPGIAIGISKIIYDIKNKPIEQAKDQYEQKAKSAKEIESLKSDRFMLYFKQNRELGKQYPAPTEDSIDWEIQAWQYVNRTLPLPDGYTDQGSVFGISDEGMSITDIRQRDFNLREQLNKKSLHHWDNRDIREVWRVINLHHPISFDMWDEGVDYLSFEEKQERERQQKEHNCSNDQVLKEQEMERRAAQTETNN